MDTYASYATLKQAYIILHVPTQEEISDQGNASVFTIKVHTYFLSVFLL